MTTPRPVQNASASPLPVFGVVGDKYSSAYCPPEMLMLKSAAADSKKNSKEKKKSNNNNNTCSVSRNQVVIKTTGQCSDENRLTASPKFDMWSLGVVLYDMCTGIRNPLFANDKDNIAQVDDLLRLQEWTPAVKEVIHITQITNQNQIIFFGYPQLLIVFIFLDF